MRSLSSVVSLFSFALLRTLLDQAQVLRPFRHKPVLEPHLNLSRAETWNLARQPLTVRCVWMRLPGKLAHQEPCLIVR